jgi:predicted nucleotide-binding protein
VTQDIAAELRQLAERARTMGERGEGKSVEEPVARLEEAAAEVARAWSGSSFGFHSRVYYADLQPPPPGAHFSSEWGFLGQFHGTTGDWREYDHVEVIELIRAKAGDPDLTKARAVSHEASSTWKQIRAEVVSILTAFLGRRTDGLLEGLKTEAESVDEFTATEAARAMLPRGQQMSRDSTALLQGLVPAPHQEVVAEVIEIRSRFTACRKVADIAERAASHVGRLGEERMQVPAHVGNERVFIGHGQSPAWRELKDFISDRLTLPWDEFNRVPVAGVTNVARLSEMLNHAGIAFLVLTAEDETADGKERARQNVVHEAGLFQGRLGFARAIVVLEEGCEEFSNIHGLGQIRFPRGRISAAFEEVRRVLEREGFLDT